MLTNDRLKKIARTRKTRLRSDTNVLSFPLPPSRPSLSIIQERTLRFYARLPWGTRLK